MKIGVSVFQNRISPRLDQSREVQIFERGNGASATLHYRASIHWDEETIPERAQCLREQGVDNLVCGAAEPWMEEHFRAHGIRLYSWVSGRLEEVLESLARGDLVAPRPQ